ncbi:hypothetical protein BDZ89DRAFT_1148555 [Hymenopellis radicata]|nr:hypothetical protein BDZ89DRAFT_1148555 [Hymenopellis radicata]
MAGGSRKTSTSSVPQMTKATADTAARTPPPCPSDGRRSRKEHPTQEGFDPYVPTPGVGRGAKNKAPDHESSPSAPSRQQAAPPSSLSRPIVQRQPFDAVPQASSSREHLYPPSMQPSTSQQGLSSTSRARSSSLNDASRLMEASRATSSTPKPVPTGKRTSKPTTDSSGAADDASTRVSVELDDGNSQHGSMTPSVTESAGPQTRNALRPVRVLINVGKEFDLFDESVSESVARYYAFSLNEDADPLHRFGAKDGRLPGFSAASTMKLRDALIRYEWPCTDLWDNITSAIEDRLEYHRPPEKLLRYKITTRDKVVRRVYSIGEGSNDIGFWGHLVLAVT